MSTCSNTNVPQVVNIFRLHVKSCENAPRLAWIPLNCRALAGHALEYVPSPQLKHVAMKWGGCTMSEGFMECVRVEVL